MAPREAPPDAFGRTAREYELGRPRYTLTSRYSTAELREQQPFNFYPFNESGLPVKRFNYQNDIFHRAPATDVTSSAHGGPRARVDARRALRDRGRVRQVSRRRRVE